MNSRVTLGFVFYTNGVLGRVIEKMAGYQQGSKGGGGGWLFIHNQRVGSKIGLQPIGDPNFVISLSLYIYFHRDLAIASCASWNSQLLIL
jgi:hypothetical protein